MKQFKPIAAAVSLLMLLAACGTSSQQSETVPSSSEIPLSSQQEVLTKEETVIVLDDAQITVDGSPVGNDPSAAVRIANDIIYYEEGNDFTYGEGSAVDAHSAEEAAAHTVVHIAAPGIYRISGCLSRGQVAVDLGEDAEKDPHAVVTLILDNADITCTAAPAVIFYNVYECGSDNAETAVKEVDTSAAGANVILADGSENTVRGSYVARIYQPDTVVLNEAGTAVEDAKKLHKYDGAFYSRMSMNIDGEAQGSGILNIYAENEGLDSELHLTVNGGIVNIFSGNDGINTNEDGVSVTTINGGDLNILVTGETGEGDGIDSNGWLVINGGTVIAAACDKSADAGLDSDMGIHINGGTVIASAQMLTPIENGGQTHVIFNFAQVQNADVALLLKDESGEIRAEFSPQNGYRTLIYSSPDLTPGSYTLWCGETQLGGRSGDMPGSAGMPMPGEAQMPEGQTPPELPQDMEFPQNGAMQRPEGTEPPMGERPPEGVQRPEEMQHPEKDFGFVPNSTDEQFSTVFELREGTNRFSAIEPAVTPAQ